MAMVTGAAEEGPRTGGASSAPVEPGRPFATARGGTNWRGWGLAGRAPEVPGTAGPVTPETGACTVGAAGMAGAGPALRGASRGASKRRGTGLAGTTAAPLTGSFGVSAARTAGASGMTGAGPAARGVSFGSRKRRGSGLAGTTVATGGLAAAACVAIAGGAINSATLRGRGLGTGGANNFGAGGGAGTSMRGATAIRFGDRISCGNSAGGAGSQIIWLARGAPGAREMIDCFGIAASALGSRDTPRRSSGETSGSLSVYQTIFRSRPAINWS